MNGWKQANYLCGLEWSIGGFMVLSVKDCHFNVNSPKST